MTLIRTEGLPTTFHGRRFAPSASTSRSKVWPTPWQGVSIFVTLDSARCYR